MKRGLVINVLILGILLVGLSGFASANIFSDFWGKLTGQAITGKAIDGAESGLVAKYSFEGDANDAVTGNVNNGIVDSGVNCSVVGVVGKSCFFNYGGKIVVGNSSRLNLNLFTYSAWVNPSDMGWGWAWVFNKNSVQLRARTDRLSQFAFFTNVNNQFEPRLAYSYEYGKWYHVAVTFDGSYMKLYVNGSLVGSTQRTGNYISSTDPLYIGQDYRGYIDELRIYNRALSASEVSEIYNLEKPAQKPVQTCTDSDNGLNYYVKGNITGISEEGTEYVFEDRCTPDGPNMGVLQEYDCTPQGVSRGTGYTCPYGCSNGACVAPTASCDENYKLKFINLKSVGGVNVATLQKLSSNTWETVCADKKVGDICYSGNVQIKINAIYFQDAVYENMVDLSVKSPAIIDYESLDHGTAYAVINSVRANISLETTNNYFVASYCGNATQPTCTDSDGGLNYYVKGNVSLNDGSYLTDTCVPYGSVNANPALNGPVLLEWSCQNNGSYLANFYACPNGCVNGACVNETPQVCQSLIDSVKNPTSFNDSSGIYYQLTQNDIYKGSWWSDELHNYTDYTAGWNANQGNNHYYQYLSIYVFDDKNFDASTILSNFYDYMPCVERQYGDNTFYVCNYAPLENKDYKYNQVLWANGNVLVIGDYDFNLNNQDSSQVNEKFQKDLQTLVNGLRSNDYQSTYGSFEIEEHLMNLINDNFNSCSSALVSGILPYSYSCKIEPIICPEYGFQNQICTSWANNQEIKKETRIYCSPGICSGCMTPKWFGGSDNKCIPYGFRFASQTEGKIISLEYIDANSVKIKVGGAMGEITPSLSAGEEYTLSDGSILRIEYIDYTSKEGASLYVTLSLDNYWLSIKEGDSQSIPSRINAYCDIDGQIYEQKTKDSAGEWAACQNNYECSSNICSDGECIEVRDIAAQVNVFKGTFVKVICKLSNLFSIDEYSQCVYKYLGEEASTNPSSGGDGGGSSSGGSSGGDSPPEMPA